MSWRAVAVIGSSGQDSELAEIAYRVGRLLAEQGVAVICGGLGGVMEAACRGAKSAGGVTVGILPGTEASAANPCIDVPICTGMGEARNTIVVRCATESVIAIGGEFGTLSEIGFALKIGKRVIGIRTWQLGQSGELSEAIQVVETAQEAVNLAIGTDLPDEQPNEPASSEVS